ncbi:MAG: dienelactone hydrolase family protein [Actinobacteria bacterium]|nr:dienelactone hydrolase family protein [Actinomycetota bacterium]
MPGLLWTPEGAGGPRPLVLIGHGGGGNKRMEYVLSLARRLVRHQGWAAAAIDGIGHGERSELFDQAELFTLVQAAAGDMITDWTATLGELRALDEVGTGPLGYWGLSMGTMFGAPFVGATPDVRVAVLGLMGDLGAADPWMRAARNITVPVLFLAQLDDELIPFERATTLFRAIGSGDKRLHAHPGLHSAVPVEEIEASEAFLAQHLRG